MTFYRNGSRDRNNHHGPTRSIFVQEDLEDKSSLEAAAEAADKVNAMLIAKGMLRPNQIHSGTNVITKKAGGPNSLVVAEVEINNLTTPCRNTLTRGTTQEEISKASGAAVTTRGRYMVPDEKARNVRDRCLYLNVQASTKDSVDVAVQKINEIIKSMCGNKMESRGQAMNFNRGGRLRVPVRPNMNRFPVRGVHNQPPPPLMSLPTPPSPVQTQIPPPPHPMPQTMTIMQEKLYIGLEHAPPNFDTKNKILGPGGSFLQHIQMETGAHVSLRGKSSGFAELNGADTFEPMHVHIEHASLVGLQEAKKLAENLIQTVQQSYVSFQQALAAMPASVPTGLFTGVYQQPTLMEPQMTHAPPGLSTITMHEQALQAVQQPQVQQLGPPPTMLMPPGSVSNQLPPMPQALNNAAPVPPFVIPQSIGITNMPLVSTIPVSATSIITQQPSPMELTGQQPLLFGHQHQAPPPQAIAQVGIQQVVQAPHGPQPIQAPVPAALGAHTHVQPTMHLVSQAGPLAPPTIMQQPVPNLIAQAPPPVQPLMAPQHVPSMSAPASVLYTVASTSAPPYYTSKDGEIAKRRFTEEKDDKIPENLLGYQHCPPQLVNLVSSTPPPQSVPPPISQGLAPPPGTQLMQAPPPGLIVSHLPTDQGQFAHLGGQTIVHHTQQLLGPPPSEGQQLIAQGPLSHHFLPGMPGPSIPHYLMGPPPTGPIPSPSRQSPSGENRPPSQGHPSVVPPPPPPSAIAAEIKQEEDSRSMPPPSSPEATWESGNKRKGPSSEQEPEKKKIRGILKNKQQADQPSDEKEEDVEGDAEEDEEKPSHPASPQYQGQPLRYPAMPSDPNLPPTSQESGIPHQHRPLLSAMQPNLTHVSSLTPVPTNLPPGHHIVQQLDPGMGPQVHIAHQHVHIEGPRPEGPPPPQIVVEHPGPHGAPIHITHHRVPAQAQIHIEHSLAGAPPRQVLIEHPAPPTVQMEHPGPPMSAAPNGHLEHIHPHHLVQGLPHPAHPPPNQDLYDFEAGTQQLPPAPPQFQNFEHVAVTQASHQQGEQLLPAGSAVIVSSTQHFPQYSVAISSAPPPPPPVSFAIQTSAPPFSIPNQPMSQPLQRLQDPQHMNAQPPPPPPPPYPYSVGLTPTSSHFQSQFTGIPSTHPQQIQGHLIQQPQQQAPPPPPTHMTSQPQYPHAQGIQYWVSQA